MTDEKFNDIKEISERINRINAKIKLLSLLHKAQNEFNQTMYENCAQTCSSILTQTPDNAIALRGLGCVMQAKGQPQKAIEFYTKALKTSLNKEIEYTLIGNVYYNENNLEEAVKNYNKAIEINDNYDSAYEGRNQAMLEYHLNIVDMQDNLIKREIAKTLDTKSF